MKTVPNLTSNVVNSDKYHPLAPVYMNVETDLHKKKPHGLIPSKLGHQSKYFGVYKNDKSRRTDGISINEPDQISSYVIQGGLCKGGGYPKPRLSYAFKSYNEVDTDKEKDISEQDIAKSSLNTSDTVNGYDENGTQVVHVSGFQKINEKNNTVA